jgi:hypothetical protein
MDVSGKEFSMTEVAVFKKVDAISFRRLDHERVFSGSDSRGTAENHGDVVPHAASQRARTIADGLVVRS